MATELGKAYVQIVPSAQGISGKIEKELNGSGAGEAAGEKTGGKFGAKFLAASGKALKAVGKVTLAATGAAATGVASVVKQSLSSFSEYEQLKGGAELMFGDAYDFIAEKAANAYSTVQMSQNDYLAQVNSFATGLKTSLNGDSQAAAELADKIVGAQADVVAATGNSAENVANAFAGIMKNNFTMLDNLQLGIKPTKEGMEELIETVNKAKGTDYEMGNLADMQSALIDYIDIVGMAGYAHDEAAGTIQGSLSMTKAAWDNLLTGLADPNADVGQLVDNLLASAETLLDNVLPVVEQVLGSIADALPGVVSTISAKLPGLISRILPPLLSSAVSLVNALASALPGILPVVIQSALQALMTLIPVLLQLLPQLLNVGMQMVLYLVQVLIQMAPQLIPAAIQMIASLIQGLLMNLPQLVAAALELVVAIVDAFLNTDWKTVGKTILKGIKGAFLGGGSDDFGDVGASLAANVSSSADTALAGASFTMPAVDMSQFDASLTAGTAAIPAPEIDWSTMSSSSTELDLGTMVNVNDTGLTTKFTDAATSSAAALTDYDWSSTGSSLLSKTANGMSASGAMRSSASRQAQNAASAVNGYDWASVGKNIVDGIAQGVTDNGENITTALTDVLNDVAENVTMTLQISSPSRVYADEVGRWIPEGIALGITQHAGTVAEAMDGAVRPLTVTGSAVRSAATETGRQYAGIGGSRSAGVTQTSSAQMVNAFKEALREMKVELDDREVGRFVERTVVRGFSA